MLVALVLAAAVSAAAAPSAQRNGSVPLGVKIGGLRVGGMPSEKARAAISYAYNRPLRFAFYGKRCRGPPAGPGPAPDPPGPVQAGPNPKACPNGALPAARASRSGCREQPC